ncbi:hypothetical protein BU230_16515 [Klebsiella pneumoniae]|nr:hypothetical protein BU230_16515 [Klebsiella pneumoniae]
MMSLWDALRMNMMISYQELVRTFLNCLYGEKKVNLLPGGISALHHASKPSRRNYQKVTFLEELLFPVVLSGVDLMQLSNST